MSEFKRVVLIDSNLFFLAKVSAVLKNCGYQVETAGSVQEVYAKVQANAVLIIVNLMAPGIKSLDWIGAIKKDPATKNVPLLGFAGHLAQEVFSAAMAAGCDRVVSNGELCLRAPEILRQMEQMEK